MVPSQTSNGRDTETHRNQLMALIGPLRRKHILKFRKRLFVSSTNHFTLCLLFCLCVYILARMCWWTAGSPLPDHCVWFSVSKPIILCEVHLILRDIWREHANPAYWLNKNIDRRRKKQSVGRNRRDEWGAAQRLNRLWTNWYLNLLFLAVQSSCASSINIDTHRLLEIPVCAESAKLVGPLAT